MASLFGSYWQGLRSNWDHIEAITEYLALTHEEIAVGELPSQILNLLARPQVYEDLRQALDACQHWLAAFQYAFMGVTEALAYDTEASSEGGEGQTYSFSAQRGFLQRWEANVSRLHEIIRWNNLVEEMNCLGLSPILDMVLDEGVVSPHLVDIIDWYRCQSLIETAMIERPELIQFDGAYYSDLTHKFVDMDKRLLELNRAYLAKKHWEGLPRQVADHGMRILAREFEKKRRHLPIRQLIAEAGQTIQKIKPVFLMSPLSVATYLPPGSIDFDLVIFDEASQVLPVDAFGAILRGRQTVVVGDSKQLSPTTFFEKLAFGDNDEEAERYAEMSDLESILALFIAQGAPTTMLRWHYRSRHESLIAVSNHEFYDDQLVVFPAPEPSNQDVGLFYRYLDNRDYHRGQNFAEAAIVAQAVMEHARTCPHLSLGVASFSLPQRNAIEDELERLRREDPSCEEFFERPDEPFFIKNLENVQGDERDVIFISIGYGRTPQGTLSMNFGPLNSKGGERRLNVLISRARQRCVVFSSLRADDIDLSRSSARGVAALKAFLKYAETQEFELPQKFEMELDPLVEVIAQRLRHHGISMELQIGVARHRLDMAVVDPKQPGRYLLGIECDGSACRRTPWARDRDRLWPQTLENSGWSLHRIWSIDWFRDPEGQLGKLLELIHEARQASPNVSARPALPLDDSSSLTKNGDARVGVEEKSARRVPLPATEDIRVPAYRMASLELAGQDLSELSPSIFVEWVRHIVITESPVHWREVMVRIIHAAAPSHNKMRIQEAVRIAINTAVRRKFIARRGDFLWRIDMERPPIRNRAHLPTTSRNIDRISLEEIGEAIRQVVYHHGHITLDDALVEACRLLGYGRMTARIKARAKAAIQKLLEEDLLSLKDGHLHTSTS